MKILITGISGLLGSELAKTLGDKHEVEGLTLCTPFREFKVYNADISDLDATYAVITKANPDLVIHAAAVSNVDECERNPLMAYRVNTFGTRNVAVACQRFDTSLLYVSTDYVFPGTEKPEKGYSEFDAVSPVNVYGESKLRGEIQVQQLLAKYYIVRVSWLFGPARSNYVSQIADAIKTGKEIRVAGDMVSAPTCAKDVALGIRRLVEKPRYGTFHLTNSGFASRYDVAAAVAEMMGAGSAGIRKIEKATLKLPARRPDFSGMRNYVWEIEGLPPRRPWQEAVREYLSETGYLR